VGNQGGGASDTMHQVKDTAQHVADRAGEFVHAAHAERIVKRSRAA
jgi:hypothetical protein